MNTSSGWKSWTLSFSYRELSVNSTVVCDNDDNELEQIYTAYDDDNIASQQLFVFDSYSGQIILTWPNSSAALLGTDLLLKLYRLQFMSLEGKIYRATAMRPWHWAVPEKQWQRQADGDTRQYTTQSCQLRWMVQQAAHSDCTPTRSAKYNKLLSLQY